MTQTDILTRPAPPPDRVLSYGPRDDQLADLRLPRPGGPADSGARPIVLFLHGGFWRSAYDRTHTWPLGQALAEAGYVVCTPEFRRTGQPGGGYPGTFDDIAAAVDALPGLVAAEARGLADPGRVVLAGHSAGGHLALWAAGRHRLPPGSPWRPDPAGAGHIAGVVSLAGVCDLVACSRLDLDHGAVDALIGGDPDEYPDRYEAADPMALTPLRTRIRLVHGTADDRVPHALSEDFFARAEAAGDNVFCELLPGCGHFELIDPLSEEWPAVLGAIASAAGSE